jgi:hypothetical protein
MKHAAHTAGGSIREQRGDIGIRIAGVHDHWHTQICREPELRLERGDLCVTRRVIVVVVEPTLSDRHRTAGDVVTDGLEIPSSIEVRGVMGMNARGMMNEPGLRLGNRRRAIRRRYGFADRHDGDCASIASARDGVIAIDVERGIGEMRVAIDEAHTNEHRRGSAAVLAER